MSIDPGVLRSFALALEVLLICYVAGANAFYVWTAAVAIMNLPGTIGRLLVRPVRSPFSRYEIPISVVIPAYNEAAGIVATVTSLLAMRYPAYEIVVVNDGSSDDTLGILARAFDLERSSEPYRVTVGTASVRAAYVSRTAPQLRVIDKVNGGKSDALNVGLNCARFPLVFCGDGDSYYVPEALASLVRPFLGDARTIVCAGAVGVANGCEIENGVLVRPRLSSNLLVQFQVLEYLRAFLGSRLGWAPVNALSIVSGACGLYRKDVLLEAGGFRTDTIWEDMEITLRLHHLMRAKRAPYRIAFTPATVCWTTVPDTWEALWRQRVGWHRHLSEVLAIHRRLVFRGGVIGALGMPYLAAFEWLAPVMMTLGIAATVAGCALGVLAVPPQLIALAFVMTLGLLVSTAAVFLNVIGFQTYGPREVALLLRAAVLELFGYRLFATLANLAGFGRWWTAPVVRGKRVVGARVRPYDPRRSADWRVRG